MLVPGRERKRDISSRARIARVPSNCLRCAPPELSPVLLQDPTVQYEIAKTLDDKDELRRIGVDLRKLQLQQESVQMPRSINVEGEAARANMDPQILSRHGTRWRGSFASSRRSKRQRCVARSDNPSSKPSSTTRRTMQIPKRPFTNSSTPRRRSAKIQDPWKASKASPLLGFLPVLFGDDFETVWKKMTQKEKNDLHDYAVEMQVSREMQTWRTLLLLRFAIAPFAAAPPAFLFEGRGLAGDRTHTRSRGMSCSG